MGLDHGPKQNCILTRRDEVIRLLIRQAQDWVIQYTGRSFVQSSPDVVGWLDEWVGPGTQSIRVAPYRPVAEEDVLRWVTPELVAVKSITSIGNRERWEFAPPLEYMHKDGQVITRFNPDAEAPASRPPSAVRLVTMELAKAMLDHIKENPGASPETVPRSLLNQEMKDLLTSYR